VGGHSKKRIEQFEGLARALAALEDAAHDLHLLALEAAKGNGQAWKQLKELLNQPGGVKQNETK
jgi:hypothetical protein